MLLASKVNAEIAEAEAFPKIRIAFHQPNILIFKPNELLISLRN